MRVALALDKFKGTFSARDICEVVAEGIRDRNPKIEVIQRPMADGGEGSASILSAALGLEAMRVEVNGLHGKKVETNVYWQNARRLAVIESTDILDVPRSFISEENFFQANTVGLGQLLRKAFDLRPQEIWICVGGTLTADLGWGVANVFGLNAFDEQGQTLSPTISNMDKIHDVELTEQPDYIKKCKISVLCDVNAPARSPGVSLLSFLKHKGAKENSMEKIEKNMTFFWGMLKSKCPNLPNMEDVYTGAGGGLCIGLSAVFSNIKLELGSKKIAKATALVASFSGADLVVCGEGCLDELTLYGKTVSTVSQISLKENNKLVGIFGRVRGNENDFKNKLGLGEIYKILAHEKDDTMPQTELIKISRSRLHQIGQEIADKLVKK
ncbi:MAG: glycerate kinase [Bdellovibrionota bacterium]